MPKAFRPSAEDLTATWGDDCQLVIGDQQEELSHKKFLLVISNNGVFEYECNARQNFNLDSFNKINDHIVMVLLGVPAAHMANLINQDKLVILSPSVYFFSPVE